MSGWSSPSSSPLSSEGYSSGRSGRGRGCSTPGRRWNTRCDAHCGGRTDSRSRIPARCGPSFRAAAFPGCRRCRRPGRNRGPHHSGCSWRHSSPACGPRIWSGSSPAAHRIQTGSPPAPGPRREPRSGQPGPGRGSASTAPQTRKMPAAAPADHAAYACSCSCLLLVIYGSARPR